MTLFIVETKKKERPSPPTTEGSQKGVNSSATTPSQGGEAAPFTRTVTNKRSPDYFLQDLVTFNWIFDLGYAITF